MSSNQSVFYYMSYAPPKPSSKRLVSSYLRALGCSSFTKLFWRIPSHQLRLALSYSELENVVVLKRSRGYVKHMIDEKSDTLELGSLVVIAYKLKNPSIKTRKIVQRALQRAPCFKLCPSVYAFPLLRKRKTAEHGKSACEIITAGGLIDVLNRLDGKVLMLSRMVVLEPSMGRLLVERMKAARRGRCRKLIQACRNILSSIRLQGELLSTKAYKLRLSEIKYRYRAMRGVLDFLRKEMGIDMSRELVKVSRAIGLCHRVLREAEETQAVATVKSLDL